MENARTTALNMFLDAMEVSLFVLRDRVEIALQEREVRIAVLEAELRRARKGHLERVATA